MFAAIVTGCTKQARRKSCLAPFVPRAIFLFVLNGATTEWVDDLTLAKKILTLAT